VTEKTDYFNKYLKVQTLTLEQEVKAKEPEHLAPPISFLDANL
jgi:hypothetical protein